MELKKIGSGSNCVPLFGKGRNVVDIGFGGSYSSQERVTSAQVSSVTSIGLDLFSLDEYLADRGLSRAIFFACVCVYATVEHLGENLHVVSRRLSKFLLFVVCTAGSYCMDQCFLGGTWRVCECLDYLFLFASA